MWFIVWFVVWFVAAGVVVVWVVGAGVVVAGAVVGISLSVGERMVFGPIDADATADATWGLRNTCAAASRVTARQVN